MNIWQIEAEYLARLAPQIAGVLTYTTFDDIDWTAADAPRVAVQTVYDGLDVPDEVRGSAALLGLRFQVHVWLKLRGASAGDKTASANALSQAIRAATAWEVSAGRYARLVSGQRTGFDAAVLRVSIAFSVPVVATALT